MRAVYVAFIFLLSALSNNDLDREIESYKNRRDLYRAKAAFARNQGDRLQFTHENLSDAKMYWKKAEAYDEIADVIQKKIDELEKQKGSK